MFPEINLRLAQQRAEELRREAEAYRRAREAAGGRRRSHWFRRAPACPPIVVSRPA
ncbi:hypothetical protein [Actinoplanes sp. L3-i22]|uniref:hypothetical protein n=1 Tax=Actinoplanes sp. L3-i22 TaxID=2836373 RepID=UPI001C75ED8A|nr:hypothetical protein [Actinoplanes sp. L3-i22]BCY06460.1 hypothetical protein L3i22_015480 [Actinoplanes sp. L3-i22]